MLSVSWNASSVNSIQAPIKRELKLFDVLYCSILKNFNPKPHGSGRICPHYFQRPITQKGLKQKNRQKSAIPRKKSAA